MNEPKRHHFVPQLLQRRFAADDGRLFVFDRDRPEEGVTQRTPGNTFVRRHFYSTKREDGRKDPELEKRLSELEGMADTVIRKVEAAADRGSAPGLTADEKAAWDLFFYVQWKRTPDSLEKTGALAAFEGAVEKSIARYERDLGPLSDDERARLADPETMARIRHNAIVKCVGTGSAEVLSALAGKGLAILRIEDDRRSFILGSNTVAKLTYPGRAHITDPSVEKWFPPGFSFGSSARRGRSDGRARAALAGAGAGGLTCESRLAEMEAAMFLRFPPGTTAVAALDYVRPYPDPIAVKAGDPLAEDPAGAETTDLPLDGVALRIAPLSAPGDEGEAPASDGIGEIQVQGPNVFQGYLNLPERTAEAFTADGWFRTEDRGWLDPQGYLHVVGRAATFVVTPAGENIALEELERAYEAHPAIREIGLFQRDGALKAVVAPEPSAARAADPEALARTMREAVQERARTLPRFKHIETLRVSRDPLARTRLGKLRRDKLRQRFDALAPGADDQSAGATVGPMAIADMSGEDQALLDHPAARAAWEELCERRPDLRLTPDSHVTLDLGIDSLEWITLTLAIRARADVELSEAATGRIETVRDLMREAVAEAGRAPMESATLAEDPERFLTPDQRRWLEPLGPAGTAAAWLLYHLNRLAMRALFRLRVSGHENLSPDAQVILTPNHASVLDPFALAAAAPYPVLKRSAFAGWTGMAFANPLTRAVARLGGTFPVAHERAAFSSLALALVTLRRGKSLIWFPEGRRARDGALQPFLPGIGVLLQTHPTPVVPAVIDGAFEAMPTGRRLPRPGRIRVHFGKPVTPGALEAAGAGATPEARLVDGLQRERLTGLSEGFARMPFNKLHVPHDLPSETCRAINAHLHESLVETCGVSPQDDFSLVCRYAEGDMMLHPTFLGERDPAATVVIEIALLAGRSDAQKEALYKDVRRRLRGIGFKPENSIVFLVENEPIDWSFSEAGSVKTALGL
eukprot:g1124.t1